MVLHATTHGTTPYTRGQQKDISVRRKANRELLNMDCIARVVNMSNSSTYMGNAHRGRKTQKRSNEQLANETRRKQ